MDRAGRRSSRGDAGEGAEDDREPGDVFGRNFSNPGSALQGLLRKLGAGFEDMLPGIMGVSGTRIKGIITGLRQVDDEGMQLSSLTELCELLSVSTEEALATFPVETVVPLLVQLLGTEHNPDMMLLSARALTFMADVLPSSCGAILRHGAVPAFCARLLSIEYIDLAEQSLQALEKLSHEHPSALLQHGGLLAVLSFLDFFPTGVQRVAVATAANICAGLRAEHAPAVREAIPILIQLLQYHDAKIVDHTCGALMHVAEAFRSDPAMLEALHGAGLVSQATQLVAAGGEASSMSAQLGATTYFGLLKVLATCAGGSALVAEHLLSGELPTVLSQLLAGSAMLHNGAPAGGGGGLPALQLLRSADQLYEVVSLAHELLPAMPDASSILLQNLPARGRATPEPCVRTAFLQGNPDVLLNFTQALLPLLLQVYGSTVMPTVRHRCLSTIVKMLFFCSPEQLRVVLAQLPISSFIAGLLGGRDPRAQAYALQMAEILMEQLPDVFTTYFVKEGVAHALEQLAAQAVSDAEGGAADGSPGPAAAAAASSPPPATAAPQTRSRSAHRGDGGAAGSSSAAAASPHATAAGPPAARTISRLPSTTLRQAVLARAQRFRDAHFKAGAGSGSGVLETQELQRLRQLCAVLPNNPAALKEVFEVLTRSVSVFELLSSGAVKALIEYLHGAGLTQAPGAARDEALLRRLRDFSRFALDTSVGTHVPLLALVRKLQAALASTEAFPVLCSRLAPSAPGGAGSAGRSMARTASGSYGAGGSSLSSGLAALAQPFKLRLVRHTEENTVREYPANIVLIEPLATMTAIEDFLWPRVSRGATPDALRARAAAATAAAAAPAAPPPSSVRGSAMSASPPAGDGGVAANTRGAAARRSAAAAGGGAVAPEAQPHAASQSLPIPCASDGGARRSTRNSGGRTRGEETVEERRARGAGGSVGGSPMSEDSADATHGHHHRRHSGAGGDDDVLMQDAADALPDGEGDAGGASGEGGDDPIFDEDEDEDDEGDEEDEGELPPGSMPVHDLHLGEGVAGSLRAEAAAAPSSLDTASLARRAAAATAAPAGASAAAAAPSPAAAASAPAGAATPPPRTAASVVAAAAAPKLAFYMDGQLLPSSTTVFHAIQQAHLASLDPDEDCGEDGGDASTGGGRRRRRLWDEIYTLHYRLARGDDDAGEHDGAAGSPAPAAGAPPPIAAAGRPPSGRHAGSAAARRGGLSAALSGSSQWQQSPLYELLTLRLPDNLNVPEACREVLVLLQLLEAVHRLAPRLGANLQLQGAGEEALAPLGHVPAEEWVSSKISSKMAQQLKDVLAICGGGLPSWCGLLSGACRSLFPFEVRRRYFYSTAFGLARALQHMQQQQSAEGGGERGALERDGRELRVGRLQRQKVRVSRKRILDSAIKVMELYAKHRAVLELEYFGEVGTGLGPTLEFYTLLSHELQRTNLRMWRREERPITRASPSAERGVDTAQAEPMAIDSAPGAGGKLAPGGRAAGGAPARPRPSSGALDVPNADGRGDYVYAPYGLFPSPLPLAQRAPGSKVLDHFKLLGRTVAKALQDCRLLDLPLSPVFYRAALGRPLDLTDLAAVDPALGSSLERLARALTAWQAGGCHGPLMLDDARLSDLCLTFTLPGHPDYELRPGGADTAVDDTNLGAYIDAVLDATLGSGVAAQLSAFRSAFQEVFPLSALAPFREDELELLLCGGNESWDPDALSKVIKFDHGYTASSAPVRYLLELLCELGSADQRRFLRFVTGCPRLPTGGVGALQPRLTVVRKHPTGAGGAGSAAGAGATPGTTPVGSAPGGELGCLADGDLPSVMTCANYIKLPPYSSKEVMRERLLYAIREGQGSFDLS